MKKFLIISYFFCAVLVGNVFGLSKYTYEMTEAHLLELIQAPGTSPYISPTISCNPSKGLDDTNDILKDYVIGVTPGNDSDNPDFPNHSSYDDCPAHNIYAYKISDPCSSGPKVNIVVMTGIHGGESNGTWACRGMEYFCASDEVAAVNLRKIANIFVYPLCNPDGRYLSIRGNPELLRMIEDEMFPASDNTNNDMNRVWHLNGYGLSTIDALVPAILADTGGTAEYFFDFHGGGTTYYYTLPQLWDSPFAIEFAALDPHDGGGDPVLPHLERPGDHRMTRVWAMRSAPEGLNVKFGCTPENDGNGTEDERKALGRLYGLATYNAMIQNSPLVHRQGLNTMSQNWLSDNRVIHKQGDQLIGQWNFDNNDVNDSSGNGHHGIIVGDVNIINDPCRGLVLNCPGGEGNYVNCGGGGSDTWADGMDQISITVWAKIQQYTTEYQYITAKEGAWRVMRNNETTSPRFYTNGSPTSLLADTDIQGGEWHHIAAVSDGSYKYIYIDGVLENSVARNNSIYDSDDNIIIGGTERSDSQHRTWKGLIDDVRIYNYALDANEIEAIYQDQQIEAPDTNKVIVCQAIPDYDLNEDCVVNFLDFAILASTWLKDPSVEEGILSKEYYSDNVSDYEFIDATWSHNLGGGDNRILLVAVAQEDDSTDDMEVVRITYNNVEMLPVPDSAVIAGYSNKVGTRFYYLLEEDLPEPGFHTVSVTYAGSVLQRLGGSISRSGVVQQAPVCLGTNINTGQDSISSEVTTISDNAWIIDAVVCDDEGSFTTTTNGMVEWLDVSGSDGDTTLAGAEMETSGSITMSWQYDSGANNMIHSIVECELLD